MIIDLVYVLLLFESHKARREGWQQQGSHSMCQAQATGTSGPQGIASHHRALRRPSAATKGEAELVHGKQRHSPGPGPSAHLTSETPEFYFPGSKFREKPLGRFPPASIPEALTQEGQGKETQ